MSERYSKISVPLRHRLRQLRDPINLELATQREVASTICAVAERRGGACRKNEPVAAG